MGEGHIHRRAGIWAAIIALLVAVVLVAELMLRR